MSTTKLLAIAKKIELKLSKLGAEIEEPIQLQDEVPELESELESLPSPEDLNPDVGITDIQEEQELFGTSEEPFETIIPIEEIPQIEVENKKLFREEMSEDGNTVYLTSLPRLMSYLAPASADPSSPLYDYQTQVQKIERWCNQNNALLFTSYNARQHLDEAVEQTSEEGKNILVINDLS